MDELKCLKILHCLIQNLVSFENKFPERINVESLSQVGGGGARFLLTLATRMSLLKLILTEAPKKYLCNINPAFLKNTYMQCK